MSNNISYIICTRISYAPQSTLSRITLTNDEHQDRKFCFCLEDTVRKEGIKVCGSTAIPDNLLGYKIAKTYSPRFKRDTLQLYNVSEDLSVDYDFGNDKHIHFEGVRVHGGNKHEDTEGCPLVAYDLIQANNKKDFIIQSRADNELMAWYDIEIAKGREVRWVVINKGQ